MVCMVGFRKMAMQRWWMSVMIQGARLPQQARRWVEGLAGTRVGGFMGALGKGGWQGQVQRLLFVGRWVRGKLGLGMEGSRRTVMPVVEGERGLLGGKVRSKHWPRL